MDFKVLIQTELQNENIDWEKVKKLSNQACFENLYIPRVKESFEFSNYNDKLLVCTTDVYSSPFGTSVYDIICDELSNRNYVGEVIFDRSVIMGLYDESRFTIGTFNGVNFILESFKDYFDEELTKQQNKWLKDNPSILNNSCLSKVEIEEIKENFPIY